MTGQEKDCSLTQTEESQRQLAVKRVERFLQDRDADIARGGRSGGDRIYFPFLVDLRTSDLRVLLREAKR